MKSDSIIRNLRVFLRAQSIILEIKLQHFAARSGLMALAALIAVFGLAMLDLAAYFALEPVWGRVWAATSIGIGDLILAVLLFALAGRLKPGRDLELAQEIQKSAVDALTNDAKTLESEILGLTRLVKNPLDGAFSGLIMPLASIVLKALKPSDKK
jgi:hypothetical protein